MDGDDFPPLIEDAHQPGLPARPDLAAHILRAARSNKPIPTRYSRPDAPGAGLPRTLGTNPPGSGESFGRSTSLNTLPPVAAWCRECACRRRRFPIRSETDLFGQTGKLRPLSAFVWVTPHARLNLALVPRHRRARRQHGRAVMLAKLRHLRVSSVSYQSFRVTAARNYQ